MIYQNVQEKEQKDNITLYVNSEYLNWTSQ